MDQSNPDNYLDSEKTYFAQIERYFLCCSGNYSEKLHAFPRFLPRQSISYFLARTEIFKKILSLHGSVFDFGVYRGASFFSWLQLSAILEPYNHLRKIIGFDSFNGFSDIKSEDASIEFSLKRKGAMAIPEGAKELMEGVRLFDLNRPLGHISKGGVVVGEVTSTLEKYLSEHDETIVALANFGFGLYEPTVRALSLLRPRLQAGSVLVFEDLNQETWPGETKALFEVFEPKEISLRRFPFCPHISYMVIGGSE